MVGRTQSLIRITLLSGGKQVLIKIPAGVSLGISLQKVVMTFDATSHAELALF